VHGRMEYKETDREYEGMKDRLSAGRVCGYGALTGAVAMSLGAIAFYGFFLLLTYLDGSASSGSHSASVEAVMMLLAIATIAVLLLPAMAGGSIVALLLHTLSKHRSVGSVLGIATGALMGTMVGTGVFWIVSRLSELMFTSEDVYLGILVGGIAALSGGGHGWVMIRWLKKMQSREATRVADNHTSDSDVACAAR
jgi:hypothetical protein